MAICNPNDPSWAELEESRVVLDDEDLRIKIEIAPPITSLSQCRRMFGDSLTVKTFGTCPNSVSVLIPDDAEIVAFSSKSEIRIPKTRQQLIDFGLLPSKDDDGVDEIAWLDMGSPDASQPSNLTDSEAFSSLGYQFRGKATGDVSKSLDSTPPNSKPSESFFKAAGCEIVVTEYGGKESERRQLMNQAYYFYYSGHGSIVSGALQGGFSPNTVSGKWKKDLNCAVFAGCSVLGIGNYRIKATDLFTKLNWLYRTNLGKDSSPGVAWEISGSKILLGYCWRAPLDNLGATKIAQDFSANLKAGKGPIEAWKLANDNNEGRNACAIDCGSTPHVYWYWHEEHDVSIWTNKVKGLSSW